MPRWSTAVAIAIAAAACQSPPEAAEADAAVQGDTVGARLRPLTDSQHQNAIRDLLGVDIDPVVTPGVSDDLFLHEAALYRIRGALLHQYRVAAAAAAELAVRRLDELLPCDPSEQSDACAAAFIESLASRAFRRPVDAQERAQLQEIFELGAADGFESGLRLAIETILIAPDFLYRTELGYDDAPGPFELTPHELAASVSFFLRDSIPDDALWEAAQDGSLRDPDVLGAHVDRLLAEPAVQAHVTDMFLVWLGAHRVRWTAKDPQTYPEFDSTLASSMVTETKLFVHDVLWRRDGSLAELLLSRETFVDEALAGVYGITGVSGAEFVPVQVDFDQRAGILSQPSILAALAGPVDGSIVHRGLFVQRRFFCAEFGAPPTDAIAAVADETSGLTEREFADYRAENATCAACHSMIDPPGIALERYDAIGRWRSTADGVEVRAAADLLTEHGAFAIDGPVELAELLASRPEVTSCVIQQFLERAFGKRLGPREREAMDAVVARVADSGGDLIEIFRALPATEAFRWRVREVSP